ncbi:hypothetical protein [Acidaminococcus timonensis]|uniref:hypothetical protein n=1 Tax=Acidaminococcus timonensis TaxID=1871002 RepID=UPI0025E514D9|nr:hypothetical protein [Acidaminococcus timonensis]
MILSDEIRRRQEEAAAEAAAKGMAKGQSFIVKRMLERGKTIQQIAEETGLSAEEIRSLAEMKA